MDTNKALKTLGSLVKSTRLKLEMNQRDFAKLFNSSHPSISNLENARYINLPDHSTLIRLSQILKIPYWQLIKELEESENLFVDLPKSLAVEEIMVGVNELNELDELLDLTSVVVKRIEKIRSR